MVFLLTIEHGFVGLSRETRITFSLGLLSSTGEYIQPGDYIVLSTVG